MNIKKNQLFTILTLLLSSFMLLLPAFINGFPFLYSDTSTYLSSGFELETPIDRPIVYGLFLRLTSLNGASLWTAIFTQSFLVSFLLLKTTQLLFKNKNFNFIFIGLMVALALFSSLPWVSTLLMPDIFTSTLLLSMIILIFDAHLNNKQKVFYYFIFYLSCSMHLSHLVFSISLIFSLLIFRNKLLPQHVAKFKLYILLILGSFSILPGISAFSKSRHIFFFGAMVEHGIVKEFLSDNCKDNNYNLCLYKDSLPKKAYEFVWNPTSPFYKTGGWKNSKKEYNEIIFSTLTRPKYIWLHLKASFESTIDQLTKFGIGDGIGSFDSTTQLFSRIENFLPNSIDNYMKSNQYANRKEFIYFTNKLIEYMIFCCVLLLLVFLIILRKVVSRKVITVSWIFIISILLNAWNNATFANALDRLGAKLIWMLPFITFLLIIQYYTIRKAAVSGIKN